MLLKSLNIRRYCPHGYTCVAAGIEPVSNTSNGTAPVEVRNVADQMDAAAAETSKTDWAKETLSIVVVGASGGL